MGLHLNYNRGQKQAAVKSTVDAAFKFLTLLVSFVTPLLDFKFKKSTSTSYSLYTSILFAVYIIQYLPLLVGGKTFSHPSP